MKRGLFLGIQSDFLHYQAGSLYSRFPNSEKSPSRRFALALLDPDFRVAFWVRMQAHLWTSGYRRLAIFLYFRLKRLHGVDIHPSVRFGNGLRFVHAHGIVIGQGVVLGSHIVIFGGVTLGKARPDSPYWNMPLIGTNVILGAGAKILGGVKIPSFTLVHANAVISRSSFKGGELCTSISPLERELFRSRRMLWKKS